MTERTCPRIQIAGVHDLDEAQMLARAGVDSVGLPLRLAHHPEDVTEAVAADIVRGLASAARAVLITYLTDPGAICEFCDALGVTDVQLHADMQPAALAELKARRPDLYVIKSVIVPPAPDRAAMQHLEAQVQALAPHCDAFLTDSFDPSTGATGATGKTHDWSVSSRLAELSPIPLILAGGLDADNVRRAVAEVRPAGVDAHTGVEAPDGRKSPRLVERFVREAKAGFEDLAR